MRFLSVFLLFVLIQIPFILFYREPATAIVQQNNSIEKAQVDKLILEGDRFLSTGNYSAALDKFQRGLVLAKKNNYKQAEGVAASNIGQVYQLTGEYTKALEYYQQALTISKAIGDKAAEGIVLNNMGVIHLSLGQYPKALEYFHQSLTITKLNGDKPAERIVLGSIGGIYYLTGQYTKALEYFHQSLIVAKSIGNKSGEKTALNNIGGVYQSLGQYTKALEYFQQSLTIAKSLSDKPGEKTALNNIGSVYNSLEQHLKALEYFQQSLTIARSTSDKSGEGAILGNIGSVYSLREQYPKALEYFQQSLTIAKSTSNKSGEGAILGNIGSVYNSLGQYPKSLEYFQQSLTIAKSIGNKYGEGATLTNIGFSLISQKQPALAERKLREAIAIWETIKGNTNNSDRGLSDSDKISFADRVANTYKFLQISLIEQNKIPAALEIAERGRARALAELLAARSSDPATNTLKPPNLAKIQQIAKSQNATLVEYSLIDKIIYIWVIQPNGQIAFQQSQLPANTNIKDLVNTSRDGIGVTRGRKRSGDRVAPPVNSTQGDLKLLHKLLIAPIAKSLPTDPDRRIIIIPQGELFLVPFVALQDSQGKYLIEQHTISTATAIGLLNDTPTPAKFQPKQGTALVVGNPIMPLAPDGSQLISLEGAAAEAKAVSIVLKTNPLIGKDADKNFVVNKMKSASIIHMATHGLLDKVRGDIPGAIALTNGLLTSNEIFDLKLQADLVVLSACDTGRGDLSGDGVIGLSRALAVAGVPSVAVSLWGAYDNPTQELMVEFYQNWHVKGMDKAHAMRQAMLKVMKTYKQPLAWAAFTVVGETR
jgi:CHAT domain-containing protein/Tfp pilus assembly protein PilF